MGPDALSQATWADDLLEEADRRLHEAVVTLGAIAPVLRRITDDTDWHAASARLFHVLAEELLARTLRTCADAADAAEMVRSERGRRLGSEASAP